MYVLLIIESQKSFDLSYKNAMLEIVLSFTF